MNEEIMNIEEVEFTHEYSNMEGFKITTTKQVVLVGISDFQSCCEDFGYFMTNDETKDFIGANLLDIRLTNTLLEVKDFDKEYSGEVMFVNFETNKGTLQFVAYNDHNGYYGHEAVVVSEQLNHNEVL